MREFLTSGQVGNIELNEQKRIRKEINQRWDALGMTEVVPLVIFTYLVRLPSSSYS